PCIKRRHSLSFVANPICFFVASTLAPWTSPRTVLRSNHCVGRAEGRQGLPAAPATHQALRCRTRQASGLPDQQLRVACADHRSALSLPLAGRTVLEWIKQNLRIKRFYGTTENAVKTQIPLDQALKNSEMQMTIQQNNNQLNLFN
ncbi:MAG: hypothetical protein DID90_2727552543, partial [Candidatus Nitrotoga sp. LAW]